MKATIEFDLSDLDDVKAHRRAVKSLELALVLWELQHNFAKKLEYPIELWGDECTPQMIIVEFFQKFQTLLEDNNIDLDELVD